MRGFFLWPKASIYLYTSQKPRSSFVASALFSLYPFGRCCATPLPLVLCESPPHRRQALPWQQPSLNRPRPPPREKLTLWDKTRRNVHRLQNIDGGLANDDSNDRPLTTSCATATNHSASSIYLPVYPFPFPLLDDGERIERRCLGYRSSSVPSLLAWTPRYALQARVKPPQEQRGKRRGCSPSA